ncbi:gliding motility-associated C-terminal domain-containing protein [Danxiaibacter flavus]|uniref:Gliding motility-associated C-terminal domain-containing protein n=1 Tax=Danxiaibacter flavus TaxID=3049108 RepID=A0ABV3ZNW6_9BACT|nr:gliding motility-associated C-terminal domain-containing protein [Chitinophagaceae bacterium DXS]
MKTLLPLLYVLLFVLCCTDEVYAQRLWYPDKDGDGLGDRYHPSLPSVGPPSGPVKYVQNNLDCNDDFYNAPTLQALPPEGFTSAAVWSTSIATDAGNIPYIAYSDKVSSKISVQKYVQGTGWTIVGNSEFAFANVGPKLKFAPDNTAYIAYYTEPEGINDRELIVRKYDAVNGNWNTMIKDLQPITSPTEIVTDLAFDIDNAGNLYVAYLIGDAAFVKKCPAGSTTWSLVGMSSTVGLTAINSSSIDMDIDDTGVPFIAFYNENIGTNEVSMMKFSGGTWQFLGSVGPANLTPVKIKVDYAGTPFIAFQDRSTSQAIIVCKLVSGTWQTIGAPVSNGRITSCALELDATGIPELAWTTSSPSAKCYESKFDGTSWQAASVSTAGANSVSLALDNNGMPYIGYGDLSAANLGKATVMTLSPAYINPTKPNLTPSAGPYCAGSKITITASGDLNDAANWVWYSDASFSNPLGTGNKIDVFPTADATYYARGESACVAQPTLDNHIDITVSPLPAKPIINPTGPKTICEGDHITLTAPLSASYLWSTGATTQSIDVSTAGDYTVKVKNATGCESPESDATTIFVNPAPAKPTIDPAGPIAICADKSVTLTAISAVTSPVFTWSNTSTGDKITVNTTGNYSVKVTDGNGCSSLFSDATTVTVNALPEAPTIATGGPTTFCVGDSVILTASSTAVSPTYIWSDKPSAPSSDKDTIKTAGTYSVLVKDINGCISLVSNLVTTTIHNLPDKPTIAVTGALTFCAGDSVVLAASSTATSPTYIWSNKPTSPSSDKDTIKTSGSYSVQVKDANQCISPASDLVNVTVHNLPAQPLIAASDALTFCAGDSVILTASSSATSPTYIWSNKPNAPSSNKDTIKVTGSYSVQVKDNNQCLSPASDAVFITVHSLPAKPLIVAGNALTFCAGDSVILSASSTATSPTYIWSDKPNSPPSDKDTIKTSGHYSVKVKDANQCISPASDEVTVTVHNLPAKPLISATDPLTFCSGDSVILTASSTATSPTYIWNNKPNAPSGNKDTIKVTGSYSVQVKDNNQCLSPASDAVVVTVHNLPAKPLIAANNPLTFCAGDSVILSASTTATSPIYIWSNKPNASSSNKDTIKTSGSYSVQIKDANQCTSPASDMVIVTVHNLPAKPLIAASNTLTFCTGDSIILTASSTATSPTYIWSNKPNAPSSNKDTIRTSGTYSVQVQDANQCTSPASDAVTVTVYNLPAKPLIAASDALSFCAGDSVILTASSTVTSPIFIWSNKPTAPSSNNDTIKVSGSYSVQVKDANQCISPASDAVQITAHNLPTKPTITASDTTTFCAGGSVTLTANTSIASPSYLWSDGSTGATLSVTKSGSYTVQVRDANQCLSLASNAQTVTVNPLPAKPTISTSGTTTICAGDSVILTANTTITSPQYLWSDGSSGATIKVTKSGSYTVQVQDANQCISAASNAQMVTVNALPAKPTIVAAGPTSFCSGKSVVLTANSGIIAPSYIWSNGDTNNSITVNTSGSYTVQVIDSNKCISSSSDALQVKVNAVPPKPTITAMGATAFCAGDSVVLKASSLANAPNYVWSNGQTGTILTVTTTGNYSVQVKDTSGCLSAPSDEQTITVHSLPAKPTITLQGSDTLCAGDSVILTAHSSAISPAYAWSNGATGATVTVSASGNYSVQVTDANHCTSSVSDTQRVSIHPLPAAPTITASSSTNACSGGSVTLTASAAVSSPVYLWNTGATGPKLTVTQSGNYTVQVSDANHCLSLASAVKNVTIGTPPAKPEISAGGSTTFCAGDSVVLTATSNATLPTYTWSNGSTNQTLTVFTSGNYAVQVKDSSGCTSVASDSIKIVVNPLPAIPTITSAGPLSFCQGDSVILKATAAITYFWNNQAGADTLIVRNGGTYTLTIQDANHCTSLTSKPVTVSVKPAPSKPVVSASGPLTFCQGDSVVLQAPSASSYKWSNQSTASSITVNINGNYSVKIQNAAGCWSPESAPVTTKVNPYAVATDISAKDTTACHGSPAILTATSNVQGAVFSWYSDAALQNKVGTGSPFITAPLNSNTTFYGTVRGNDVCESKPADAIAVKVSLLEKPLLTVTPKNVSIGVGSSAQLTATGEGAIVWTPSTRLDNATSFTPKASPTATTTYTATLTSPEGCQATDTSRVEVTIAYFDYNKLITPNGDGINDRLTFTNIAQYPDNKLEVFDRDGKLVYRKTSYNNEWDGRINGNVPPNNTYYFVLTVNGKVVKKGGVTIAH